MFQCFETISPVFFYYRKAIPSLTEYTRLKANKQEQEF